MHLESFALIGSMLSCFRAGLLLSIRVATR